MKKIILSSLAAVLSVSAASAAQITPYASANLGYERATFNDWKSSVIWDFDDEIIAEKSSMGNIMGNGFTLGVAGGFEYRATDIIGLRAELEYMYSHENNMGYDHKFTDTEEDENGEIIASETHDFHTTFDASTHTLMLNLYADFHNSTAFTPYLTAGLGYSWAELKQDATGADTENISIKDSDIAWQIGAGAAYGITEALSLDLGYRFVKLASIKDTATYVDGDQEKFEITPMMHQVRLGARYAF